MSPVRIVFAAVALTAFLACGGEDAPTGPTEGGTPTPVATTLTFSATVLSFSTLGARSGPLRCSIRTGPSLPGETRNE